MPNTPKLIRTELERQIRERNMTYEEFVEYAERFARDHNEPGTLSLRHLQRLAAGTRTDGRPLGPVRAATARLLERIFGLHIDQLLAPPGINIDLKFDFASIASRVDIADYRESLESIRRADREFGAAGSRHMTCRLERHVDELRKYSLNRTVRRDLAILHTEICTLAGWQSLDMLSIENAWEFYERAKLSASAVGMTDHVAHATSEQAYVLLERGRNLDAINLLLSVNIRGQSTPSQLGTARL